jgi:hydroxyacylglutathione hydrolase
MRVVPVPCLKDNFAYLVIDEAARRAAIVDPGEAPPVEEACEREGVTLAAIWLTHHHWDHVGGVEGLVAAHPELAVIAHSHDQGRAPKVTRFVDDGDTVELGPIRATIIYNPGHTLGAISYWIADGDGAVFTGDTLFGAGCGRLFEGTPAQMHVSLGRLAELPPTTRVYFGHEYTAANLRFAAAAEPDNRAVAERAAALTTPSTPSTIALERATNPFLRTAEPAVIASAKTRGADGDPVSVLGAIRTWKNEFK